MFIGVFGVFYGRDRLGWGIRGGVGGWVLVIFVIRF